MWFSQILSSEIAKICPRHGIRCCNCMFHVTSMVNTHLLMCIQVAWYVLLSFSVWYVFFFFFFFTNAIAMFAIIQYVVAMFAMLRKDCHCSALFCDATFFASVLEGCINHIACSCACVKCCFLRKIHMYYILSDSIYSASITCLLQEFCFLCIYQLC